jgi:hydrogenase-4 component F
MIWLLLAVFTPLAGVLLLALLPRTGAAGWANLGFSALSLAGALGLATRVLRHGVLDAHGFRVDAFNVYLVVLTTFVGLTTAVFSRPYMYYVHTDEKRVSARGMRLYHSMYQGFLFTMLLALTTDNLGILWVAVEGATLATVLTGGDVPAGTRVRAQHILDLERESFLRLLGNPLTQARMRHVLQTGRPLRN